MNTQPLIPVLTTLFTELVNGATGQGAYMLNKGDPGLLHSLDRLPAEAASVVPQGGGASIAAHVDHIRYGISLLNRWAAGEPNPWSSADWTQSWQKEGVSGEEWAHLRQELREELSRWLEALRQPREVQEIELNGMVSSIAHLAYHLGAIRQIDRATRGPSAHDD